MKKYFYLSFFLLLIFSLSSRYASGQIVRCATYELHKTNMEKDPQYRGYYENIGQKMQQWISSGAEQRSTTNGIITIPVVVHVLWNTSDQNIPDAQIQSQIDVLNEDYTGTNANRSQVPPPFQSVFGNAQLNFCLATRTPSGDFTTGIERKQTSLTSFGYGDNSVKYDSLGGLNAWDRNQYLNLWVCDLGGGDLLGYTEMPGGLAAEDGCVILYNAFGRGSSFSLLPAYNLGRTATHEIGHWLGLFHVWGDDNGACTGSDYIADTPNQANYTFGCPAFPLTDACTDTSPGVMYMNYLDYSNDNCMTMFTADQVIVMHNILASVRPTILTSMGCSNAAGIAEVNAATYIDLYPNPANSILNINSHLASTTLLGVSVYDMLGNKLISYEGNKTGGQNISINVSSLSLGLYIVVLNTDQGNVVKRFSVTR